MARRRRHLARRQERLRRRLRRLRGDLVRPRQQLAARLTELAGTAGCITEAGAEGCATGPPRRTTSRAWRSTRRLDPSTPPSPFSNAIDILQRGSVDRGADPGHQRQRLHHRRPGRRLRAGLPVRRRQRAGRLAQRRQRLRHLADQQQRHEFRPTSTGGLAQPERPQGETSRKGSVTRPAVSSTCGRPLLVLPGDEGAGGARPLAGRRPTSTSPRLKRVRWMCSIATFRPVLSIRSRANEPWPRLVQGRPGCASGCAARPSTWSVVVSRYGRNVYSTSQASSAVDIFRRIR